MIKLFRNAVKIACVLLIMVTSISANTIKNVSFIPNDIVEAKRIAHEQNKLVFVDFYASWCGPCRWMDETTFSDPSVVQFLDQHFVSVKVNIDDFEGYNWKEFYNIQTLPSLLIFNADGKLVNRMEETMAPSDLLKVLEGHSGKKFEYQAVQPVNSAPQASTLPSKTIDHSETKNTVVNNKGYRVLLGVFTNQTTAYNYYVTLKRMIPETPLKLFQGKKYQKEYYKVMLGPYESRDAAQNVLTKVRTEQGLRGEIE